MASQKDLDRQKELNKLRKEGVLTSKEQVEQDQLEAKLAEEKLGTSKERLEVAYKELEISQAIEKVTGESTERLKAQEELLAKTLKIQQEKLATMIAEGAEGDVAEEKLKEQILLIETLKNWQEEAADAAREYSDQISSAGTLAINLGRSIGLASKFQESFMGKMSETLDGLANNVEAQKKFKKQIKETFHPMNLLAGTAAKVFQSTMAAALSYDQAATSFNAATGAAGDYNEAISDASRGMTHLGVGAGEAGAAMGALHANMSSFSNLSKASATTIAQGTAALTKLGISGETTAQNLEFLTKHMGLSAEAAMKQQTQLAEFAGGIGVGPAKMASDFAAAAPKLIAYGAAGERIFKNLAITAKSTGIEMQALLGITEQFDTFEGAAQAAGKLNAMLGGPLLNSVELLTASDDERIKMMQDAVTQSGKSWESLNKFEKKAIAAAAGISDLDTAGKMFGNNSEEVMEKQKNLNEMIEKSQAVTEKLKNIMMALAISVGPLVDIISSAISTISEFVSEHETAFHVLGIVITVMAALVVGIKAFVAIGALFISTATMMRHPIQAMKKPIAEVGKSMAKSLAQGIRRVAAAAKSGGNSLMKLGFAILMVGAGIGLAALGVAQLVAAFAGLNGFQIAGAALAIGLFMFAMVAMAKVMLTAGLVVVPGMLAMGAAFLMIGAGVAIAAFGLASLIAPIVALFSLLIPNVLVLPAIAAGFVSIAAGVGSLATALALIKTEDLQALASLGSSLSDISVKKSVAFTASMEGLESAIDAADKAGLEVVVATSGLASTFAPSSTPLPAGAAQAAAQNIKQGVQAGSRQSTQTQAGPTTVQLILNDREFARAVINVMDKKLNLRTG